MSVAMVLVHHTRELLERYENRDVAASSQDVSRFQKAAFFIHHDLVFRSWKYQGYLDELARTMKTLATLCNRHPHSFRMPEELVNAATAFELIDIESVTRLWSFMSLLTF